MLCSSKAASPGILGLSSLAWEFAIDFIVLLSILCLVSPGAWLLPPVGSRSVLLTV